MLQIIELIRLFLAQGRPVDALHLAALTVRRSRQARLALLYTHRSTRRLARRA